MLLLAVLGATALSSLPSLSFTVPPDGHKFGSSVVVDDCDRAEAQFGCASRLLLAGHDKEGVEAMRSAAAGGDNRARRALGLMLIRGEYLPRDQAEAVRWFLSAAGHGDRASMAILATLYRDGIGTAPDPRKAALWQSRAAR
ncbi:MULTISPECIES: tetratricopeptide repeat protein [Sphingomonas]|uniref:tetratricopeptide repeat protein n=1 Tax=Sphingomonas TaxID=13687 RepID=UPI000DEEAA6C|nr:MULTISPECIES: tetratricopeptide repeat protein [Sphingomonas]